MTGVSGTAGPGSVSLSWSAPSTGGAPASYVITPYIGSTAQPTTTVTGNPPATTATVSGLTAGTAYTFTVAGVNGAGTGPASAPSSPVTPQPPQPPSAPTGVTASAASSQALLSWTAPASNNGAPISGYTITPYVGSTAQTPVQVGASSTSTTVTGLTNGTSYTFTVSATNSAGTGSASAASGAVTPEDTIFDFATPGTTDSGDGSSVELGVKFQTSVGGTVTGIRFYKAATNTGTHIGSLWTAGGSLLASATFSGESASGWQNVTFSSPVSISANTTYVAGYFAPNGHYSASSGAFSSAVANGPLTGLANGTSANGVYAYGSSSSFPTNNFNATSYSVDVDFQPGIPGQVTGVSGTAGPGSVSLSWSAPSSGSAPTSYVITPYIGSTAQSTTTVTGTPPATSATVSGLTSGTAYTFTVQAVNGAGSGPVSAPSSPVTPQPPLPPAAPTAVTAVPATAQALVSWTAPASNGSPITGYTVTPYIGSAAQTPVQAGGSATSATVTGLTNGTSYTFKVAATNAGGTGSASSASNAVTPQDTIFDFATPTTIDSGDTSSVELGVQFRSATAGTINGIRFYKAATNTGTHIGSLWTAGGTLLASATFSGETASGWQNVTFSSPVSISANTTYVAGYLAPNGHYSATNAAFASAGVTNGPLTALANTAASDGVYAYSGSSTFPSSTWNATNYYVDVDFQPAVPPGQVTGVSGTPGAGSVSLSWSAPSSGGAPTSYVITPYIGSTAQSTTTVTGSPPGTSATVSGLTAGTAYTFTVQAVNAAGSGPASAPSSPVTPNPPAPPAAPTGVSAAAASSQALVSWTAPSGSVTGYTVTPYIGSTAQTPKQVGGSITSTSLTGLTNGTGYTFKVSATNAGGTGSASTASNAVTPEDTIFDFGTPATTDSGDTSPVEIGVKFQSSAVGTITGIRFYKASTNTGTHIGSLWTAGGTLLASGTFSGETASGWQNLTFSSPVSISANTTYVAGYLAPNGHYSNTNAAFASAGVTNGPLTALANGTSSDGVYAYSASSTFPTSTFNSTNYYVDVDFQPAAGAGQVTGVSGTPGPGSVSLSWSAPTSGSAPTSYVITPYIGSTAQSTTTVTGNPPATSATVSGLTSGTAYTFTVQAVNAGGAGPASAASAPVTPQPPLPPSAVSATAATAQALVSWTPSSSNGNTITGYTVTPYIGSTAQTPVQVGASATSTTVTGLTNGTAYTFAVAASDAGGTGPASSASNAVTPQDTIFDFTTPTTIDSGDTSSVELGVQFQSSVAGTITGVRFYKAATNTGTHIGSLWTAGGTLLASATFIGETASGWQNVTFSSPVSISANTTYVAGYLAPNGHYAAAGAAFASAGVTNGPLTALANTAASDGLYAYSGTSTFPTNTFNATNYYVDVDFQP